MHSAFISSRLRYRAMPLARQLVHKGSVHPGPLVLGTTPFKSPAPTDARDRTVSRRSEPSSRTALIGEQPNPWNLLHLQDAMSRHRGAKPVFFFSSRRRHTRFDCDWSSDVCSSDLPHVARQHEADIQ